MAIIRFSEEDKTFVREMHATSRPFDRKRYIGGAIAESTALIWYKFLSYFSHSL